MVDLHELSRRDDEWPASVVLEADDGRRVDAHPLELDVHGDGWQPALHGAPHRRPREHLDARGRVGGRELRCITPELQLRWHRHDDFDDVDWRDLRALCDRFDLRPQPLLGSPPGFLATKRTV